MVHEMECETAVVKRMKLVDSDLEFRLYERTFTGRMTKLRWKILSSWCRRKSWSQHCGHDWDCCGCLHAQSCGFTYKHNQVTIRIQHSFSY